MTDTKTAGIIFWTEDNKLVLQRRDDKAPTSPNKLGLFGGHIQNGEDPIHTIIREIHEETTVPLEEITYQFIDFIKTPPSPGHDVPHGCYVFAAHLKNEHFKVFEGVGAEIHGFKELLAREDIGWDTMYILNKMKEGGLWL